MTDRGVHIYVYRNGVVMAASIGYPMTTLPAKRAERVRSACALLEPVARYMVQTAYQMSQEEFDAIVEEV